MELEGKVAVVTGAASGIGRAMAQRFAAEGARGVMLADLDVDGVEAAAAAIGPSALPVECDVSTYGANERLIDAAEKEHGAVDLFCANAGIGGGTDLDTPDDEWDLAFDVNVRSHVWAARRLVPGWVARGEGYFLSTASAAGLLTQLGSAPYAVTKHAAVAFAEWLAISYGDQGVKVGCLCPMAVDTKLLEEGMALPGREGLGARLSVAAGTLLAPEDVAATVVEAIRDERFLILPHPEVGDFFAGKGANPDGWLAAMRHVQARELAEVSGDV
jgi:NAD(P)-dependent dehydrogenase (short-subunit alcohol dehydrogenase family)